MTRISPDERCECGGQLVPPNMTTLTNRPGEVDYVCVKCGRTYAWRGTPPQLITVVPSPNPTG
jgi:hypothetical protein